MQLILEKRISKKWLFPAMLSVFLLSASFTLNILHAHWHRMSAYVFPESKTSSLAVAHTGVFSVLTYNIAGLPEPISSAVTSRPTSTAIIGNKLNNYDIVHVQEDFNYNEQLYHGGNKHPYRTPTKGVVPFGDGLNTLSKFPIREIRRIAWTDCTGADCLTPKGFSYSRIEISHGVYIDFYNVHANAANYSWAAAARRKNILQLSDYIKNHSAGKAVIIMGDLNSHYSFQQDNVKQLLTDNKLEDAWVKLMHHNQFPEPDEKLPDNQILQLTDTCESIDKILFRSSSSILLNPGNYRLEKTKFTNQKGQPLSDHCPVELSFSWLIQK